MSKIGWGIVGYGVIGKTHANAIVKAPGAELVAVCDIDPRREKIMRAHGFKANFYASQKEMLRQEPGIQAVSICTPSGLHCRGTVEAARAGRHVLSEKPLDVTLANMDKMIETCDKAGVKLGCIFQKRTSQSSFLVKKALQKKMLGKLVMGDCHQKYYRSPAYFKTAGWRGTWKLDGGGALMNQAVHGVDLLLWFMGDVESVFAYTDRIVRDIEVEDTSVAVLRFKNGALGNLIGTTTSVPGRGCQTTIHGERGTIMLNAENIQCWVGKAVKGVHKPEEIDLADKFHVKKTDDAGEGAANDNTAISLAGHAVQVQDFCDAISKNRQPMITGLEARRAVELILAIYKSWRTRREVRLPLS